MDRPLDLFEELDLTPEALYAKRRAEFDCWFDLPDVRLYEAVMLSVRIIPQSYYRLEEILPAPHLPRYPDEFWFRLDRPDFHDRMVLAVAAVRTGALRSTADTFTLNESECRIALAEVERWANKENLSLPPEWRRGANPSTMSGVTPQQRRERNNLLRIIRALMRAAEIRGEASLLSVVEHAPLLAPPDRSAVVQAFRAIPLVDKQQDELSLVQKDVVQQIPEPNDLIGIIAALACIDKLRIDLRPRKGGAAKRIEGHVDSDRHALGDGTATKPGIDTIEAIVRKVRAVVGDRYRQT